MLDHGTQLEPATFRLANSCTQSEGDGPVVLLSFDHLEGEICWLVINWEANKISYFVYDTGADVVMLRQR